MDDIGLETLWSEIRNDCDAADQAQAESALMWEDTGRGRLEATAHYLMRFYNIIEQMALRVAKAFENNIDDEKGWHSELMRRMTLTISGVRPALFSAELANPLQKLRGFRHVLVHAYDLEIDPDLLALQLKFARQVREALRGAVRGFVESVAAMHGLAIPPK